MAVRNSDIPDFSCNFALWDFASAGDARVPCSLLLQALGSVYGSLALGSSRLYDICENFGQYFSAPHPRQSPSLPFKLIALHVDSHFRPQHWLLQFVLVLVQL